MKSISKKFCIVLGIGVLLTILGSTTAIQSTANPIQEEEDSYRILFVLDKNWGGNVPSIINRFNSYGWDVTTTAVNKTVIGCSYVSYSSFEVDETLDNLSSIYMYDCVSILPGSSHENLLDNLEFHTKIQNLVAKGIIVTAWCRAVRILARANVINGRNVTGYDAYQTEYEAAGATFSYRVPPILDGNVITSVRSNFYQDQTCDLIRTTVEENKPDLLDFSTYLGGSGDERGGAASLHYLGDVAVDSEGNIIVVGRSESNDFPTVNAYQDSRSGGIDIAVSKFYPNGSLMFSTYFGGNNHEWATSVAIDSQNNIVFAGITGSTNFPLQDPYQAVCKGGGESNADCFVAKLSSDGQSLLYSTYYGGTNSDWCYEMNVDDQDRIALTGTTYSGNLPLVNSYQDTPAGSLEAFIAVFETDGQSLAYASYLGSSAIDHGRGIDFDKSGNLYLTGLMGDAEHCSENAFQNTYVRQTDAYLAKFNQTGGLEYFTYLGGSGFDRANDLRVDSNGNIIIAGYTSSTDFPTVKADQKKNGGSYDVFVTKFQPNCQKVVYSTYYGGSARDEGYAVAIDDEGNTIITGLTYSANFPSTHIPKHELDLSNGFLLKLDAKGNRKISTLFGGEEEDLGVGVAACSNHSYAVVGFTTSETMPIYHAVQGEYKGVTDFIVMKMDTLSFEINGNAWVAGVITSGIIFGVAGLSTGIYFIQNKRLRK